MVEIGFGDLLPDLGRWNRDADLCSSAGIGAIVGEWIGSNFGLGALIIEATYNFRSPQLYATVFLAALLAVLMFSLISFVERRVINWKVDASA